MALVLADRVKETTTTTGTATYTLAGASTGFESFASIGDGNTTYYACTDGTDFEVGIGTYTASGTTLARTTILQSSNSDLAVSWSAGTKTIFCCQPAEKAVFLDASGNIATFNGSNLTNVNATTLDSLDSTSFLRSDAADTKTSGNLTFSDNVSAKFGTGDDLSLYHDGTDSYVSNKTGDLYIGANDTTDVGGDVYLRAKIGENDTSIALMDDSGIIFYSNGSITMQMYSAFLYIYDDVTLQSNSDLILDGGNFIFDSGTYNTTITPTTATATRTLTLPDASGTVALTSDLPTATSDLTNDSGFITSADGGNAQTLDSLDSTQFLRSDAADIKTSGNLRFNDSVKATFGTTDDDLQIFHSGTNSFIQDLGTGNLYITSNGTQILLRNTADNEDLAKFINGGAVELYHDNSKKLETTSTGATITGTAKATTKFEVDGQTIGFTSNGATSGSGNFGVASSNGGARINADSGSNTATFVDFDATNISASGGDVTYRFGRGTTEGSSDLSQLIFYGHDGTNSPVVTMDSTGAITANQLNLGDNEKIRLGESQDLEIYHDASNTYIDQNDATLFIRNTSDTGNPSGVGIDIRNADNTGIEFPNNSGISIKRSGNTDLSFAGTGAFFNTDIVLNGATREIKWRDTTSGNFYLTLDAEQLTGSDKTITLPNVTGTVLTTSNSDTPTTTTSSSDADFVLIDDGGVMKKITPANLGVGSGGGGSGISAGKSIIFSMVFG